ncbi:bis(5'-nucleosyl)-tetraphosphatase PrpE [asymmetrical] [Lentibacillus kapialis]|uniref:Bis(5'-nucleosyl)-tetraphosphatase PrpE [asymmetrical] n=1 Tax=Lentibacillus kapialis TaxID=340214 RepID=A0A917UY55_9BACI|nr:bis(5'-nucleosyl)-tetraphosphatase PrpE [Lentibacillus kapialis]GGJ95126.1 bis(5'-nucleosyl)-tetraphosphatase PrpE [asymmetrical] [Lentibacillus kapialis]
MRYDVIGDVHGCISELHTLFSKLGYGRYERIFVHPDGRIPVFLGDITDRGPYSTAMIQLVYEMVLNHQKAYYVPGNHCNKLYRYFLGNNVQVRHGLETTVTEYKNLPQSEQQSVKKQFMELYEQAPLYLELHDVNAIAAHAGIKEHYIGRYDKKVRSFVLYGDVTGGVYDDGRPVRRDWAQHYKGDRWIVYGHTPVMEPRTVHKTINIDTGCVFGNALTAFRLPEEQTVSVRSDQSFVPEKFQYVD